jgi:transcriptional antiterminator RfaH
MMPAAPVSTLETAVPWYVVYSKPHREAMAEAHLRRKGLEVFLPRLELPDYATQRRPSVPLFPGYLFVQADLGRRAHDVMWTPGVKSLVGPNGVPAPLDAQVVAFLKRNATADGHLRARSDLRRGQEVEIIAGPMAGLIAIIEDPPDAQGRIRVLMRLLNQRPIKVRMPMRVVRSGWVA